MKRFGAFVQPLLPWKINVSIIWVCVYSLRYAACNGHEPYYHLWLVRLKIFFYIISLTHDFRGKKKKVPAHKMYVLIFSTTFV
jgi:hypothetical protein